MHGLRWPFLQTVSHSPATGLDEAGSDSSAIIGCTDFGLSGVNHGESTKRMGKRKRDCRDWVPALDPFNAKPRLRSR